MMELHQTARDPCTGSRFQRVCKHAHMHLRMRACVCVCVRARTRLRFECECECVRLLPSTPEYPLSTPF
jgi:hypothetical protein